MRTNDLRDQKTHFAFGQNWLDYSNKIDERTIAFAVGDLCRLSGQLRLDGKSFLDIGCGSGLNCLAASRLGARIVHGIDIDADSVSASARTLARFAPQASSSFAVRSIFDMTPDEYGHFDIVYSWGVLHHTGSMVRAVAAAAALVKPGGEFYVALYRRTPFCWMWRIIKHWYSRSGPEAQRRALRAYVAMQRLAHRLRGSDFDEYVQGYGKARGMNYYNDVHDWLGGFPYESISPDACRAMLADLGLTVEREFIRPAGRYLPGLMGSGCDEYACRRPGLT